MPYVRIAVFFDLNENSMMDILLVQKEPEKASYLSAIYNNYSKDQFYLKSRMLSDAELGHQINQVTFRAVITDLDDNKFILTGSPTGQSAYFPL